MTSLGDLTKLLDQGYLTGEYIFTSGDGDYKFTIKTLSPLEEVQAQRDATTTTTSTTNEYEHRVREAIETLSRCITNVNGIELDKIPGAQGTTELDKKRSVTQRFSETILVDLWKKYQELKTKANPTGTKEEADVVKK